ncbi:MAG: glycosyltransferase [Candidatus Eisenbacteria bacterium]|nr:glycosyltransferase [Candidatus Eisenbacteria bacterium]
MRVLHLSPTLPWPANSGGRICVWNQLRIDARFAEVGLLTFADVSPDAATIEALQEYCTEAEIVRRPKSLDGVVGGARSLLTSTAMNLAKYRWPVYSDALQSFLDRWSPDLVVAHHLHMGHYLPEVRGTATILREHNVDSDLMARYSETLANPAMAGFASRQSDQIRNTEARLCPKVTRCLMITGDDEVKLQELVPEARTAVLPAAIDPTDYQAVPPPPVDAPPLVVAVGSLNFRPTGEGILYFTEDVWPQLRRSFPGARFRIIGECPETLRRRLMAVVGVEVTGRVDVVRPHLEGAHVFVVPVRAGSGMRIRILEAMAHQIPLVSTTIGAEGIGVQHERHLLLADTTDDLARAVTRVIKEPVLAQTFRREGRRLVEKAYSVEALAPITERIYRRAIDDAAATQGVR